MKNTTQIIIVIVLFAVIVSYFKAKKSTKSNFVITKSGSIRKRDAAYIKNNIK